MAAPRTKEHFRLLGFPVHVGTGFILFMALLAFVNEGGEFGFWLAGSVAVFTLIHELAHAVVARWAGAEASISLEFMAGFTSYHAKRPLSRPWTIAISLAGPLAHIAIGVVTLAVLGGQPFQRPTMFDSERAAAVWWAGPVIGALNLIPVLPLDGGHATMTLLDRVIPGKAERAMIYASVAVTGGALAASPFVDRLAGMQVFIGFLLLIQLQSLFAHRASTAVSPIDAAVAAARRGDEAKAEAVLLKAFGGRTALAGRPSETLSGPFPAELGTILDRLPALPHGLPQNDYLLTVLLVRAGRARGAADYAADGFALEPHPLPACGVALAAAALGDASTAAAWLRTAIDRGLSGEQAAALVNSDAYAAIRGHPAIQAVVGPGAWPAPEPRRT